MDEFKLLHRVNNWEYITLETDEGEVYKPREKSKVRVLFPDGTLISVTVKYKTRYVTMYDHGHSSDVTSKIPGFIMNIHGLETWISFDGLKVKL